MTSDNLADLGMQPTVGKLTQQDIWRDKEKFFELARRSQEEWEKLPDENRDSLLTIVDRALDRMKDRLEIWVPDSLTLTNGQFLEITFRVLFTDLDDEMRRRDEITDRKVQRAAEETMRLVEELEAPDGAQIKARYRMGEALAGFDETLAKKWMNGEAVSVEELAGALGIANGSKTDGS